MSKQSSAPPGWSETELLLERYQLEAKMGEGGMAWIYRAWDRVSQSHVVIKVPRKEMMDHPLFRARFVVEIRSMSALVHPHVVPVYDFGEHADVPFFVMAYLHGGSLSDRQCGRNKLPTPMSLESVSTWLPQIADALDFIHSKGVVHRDVKPGNILFDGEGRPFLSDFGVVKVLGSAGGLQETTKLTQTGALVGTVDYLAPELLQGKYFDGSADQYALGITVFQVLTGQMPFLTNFIGSLVDKHINEKPPLLNRVRKDLPVAVALMVEKSLNKAPAERFGSCGEFAQAFLEAAGSPHAVSAAVTKTSNGQATQASPSPSTASFSERETSSLAPKRSWGCVLLCVVGVIAVSSLTLMLLSFLYLAPLAARGKIGHGEPVDHVAYAPSGGQFAVALRSGILEIRENESVSFTLGHHREPLCALAWHPNSAQLLTASWDQTIELWDTRDRRMLYAWTEHTDRVQSVGFADNGRLLVSAARDGSIQVVEVATREPLRTLFLAPPDYVQALACEPAGRRFAALTSDQTILVWNADHLTKPELVIENQYTQDVRCLAYHPDRPELATGTESGDLQVWDLANRNLFFSRNVHTKPVTALGYSPDGQWIATGATDGSLGVWNASSGQKLWVLIAHEKRVGSLSFDAQDNRLISGSVDGTTRFWNLPGLWWGSP